MRDPLFTGTSVLESQTFLRQCGGCRVFQGFEFGRRMEVSHRDFVRLRLLVPSGPSKQVVPSRLYSYTQGASCKFRKGLDDSDAGAHALLV